MAPKHVIVVGGGASGVLFTVHLLRGDEPDTRVTIVEKRAELGAGAAYATNHPDHLLNVRANNMSAFPDEPGHFAHWLRTRPGASPHPSPSETWFAPRHLYRDYLSGLLAPHLDRGELVCRHEEAIALDVVPQGVVVSLKGGERLAGDVVVVATGNEGPSLPPEPWRYDGWSDPAQCRIDVDAPVVVVGTGLTMVDRVMALLHAGHRGSITAVSRHGFTPQGHKHVPALRLDAADIPFGASVPRLLCWLRLQVAAGIDGGLDWRSAVDALRPHTQALWRHLSTEERRRFLRHARPFWDVHRHRIAPDAAERLAKAADRGQLSIVAAHVVGFEPRASGGVEALVAHRGTARMSRLHADAVFECRGRSPDVTRTDNPLLRHLLRSGAAQPDALRLGLDVSEDCALIDASGQVGHRLYALGPVTAGVFWEVVAIPDIRGQAARLARHLSEAPPSQADDTGCADGMASSLSFISLKFKVSWNRNRLLLFLGYGPVCEYPSTKTVVVVEDESLVREIAVCELEDHGYVVVEFANADAALAYLRQNSDEASLVLTDVQMPGKLNGLQLAEIVSRRWPSLPVLVTSGGSLVDPQRLPGKARFLPKPWRPADMVERVHGMVASYAH